VFCGEEQSFLTREGTRVNHLAQTLQLSADPLRDLARRSTSRGQFLERTIRRAKTAHDADMFATKKPTYVFDLPWIFETFPSARFIHMCRDGRDVAVSMRANEDHIGVRYDATYDESGHLSLQYCAETWRTFVNAVRGYETDSRAHTVRYEDLVSKPDSVARELCTFLDLDFASEMVEEHQTGLTGRGDSRRPHHSQLEQQIHNRRVQRWTSDLTDDQVEEFEDVAGSELQFLGYS